MKRIIYLSLVRSNLEYSSQSWSVCTKKSLLRLESVQRRATKYILGYDKCKGMEYKQRLIILNILPLGYRRELLDSIFLFKCLNGNYKLNVHNLVQFKTNNNYLVKLPHFRSESFRQSYFNRISYIWNAHFTINMQAVPLMSVNSYKFHLIKFYKNLVHKRFESDNTCTWVSHCHCAQCRV